LPVSKAKCFICCVLCSEWDHKLVKCVSDFSFIISIHFSVEVFK